MAEPHTQGKLIGVEPIGRRYYLPVWRFPPSEEQGKRMWGDGRYEHALARSHSVVRRQNRDRGYD